MSTSKATAALDDVERQPLKCGLRRASESFVRAGRLIDQAIRKVYDTRDGAAGDYGVTPSLMTRQITNQDNQHVSFQRLWSMPDDFKIELLKVLAEDLNGVEVTTTISIRRIA